MTPPATITVKALRVPLLVANAQGVPPAQILGPLGIDPCILDDADAHVPFTWMQHVWTEAPRLTGDNAFGIHAAEFLAQKPGHLVDYLSAYCKTPRAVFELIQRYQRTLGSHTGLELVIDKPLARFGQPMGKQNPPRPRHFTEFVGAQWILRWRERTTHPVELKRVTFTHTRPADIAELERVFGTNLEFGADASFIEFDASLLDMEFIGTDETLVRFLRGHADALLAQMTAADDQAVIAARTRETLLRTPPGDLPGVDRVARTLGLSERSLQRKLQEEGTSFKDVLDDVRRQLALGYLTDPRHSISDVAFLVGFSETSAFSRAFRRWTNQAPLAWRRQNTLAPPVKSLASLVKT